MNVFTGYIFIILLALSLYVPSMHEKLYKIICKEYEILWCLLIVKPNSPKLCLEFVKIIIIII